MKLALIKTGLCSGRDVGYLNVTFLKLIDWVKAKLSCGLGSFLTSGTLSMTSKINTPKVLAATIA